MTWSYYVAYFFAGIFLANGVPHFVQGASGNRFQTPFASPRGVGESSALVNVLWGTFNFVVAGALFHYFWPPQWPLPVVACLAVLCGVVLIASFLALHFGKVRDRSPHP